MDDNCSFVDRSACNFLCVCDVCLCVHVGSEFVDVQKEVAGLLKGRVLVGHGLRHDLKVRRGNQLRERGNLR